jgi:hypothetical protein
MIMICTGEESPRTNNKKKFFFAFPRKIRDHILDSKQVGWLGDRASSSIFWRDNLLFFYLVFFRKEDCAYKLRPEKNVTTSYIF